MGKNSNPFPRATAVNVGNNYVDQLVNEKDILFLPWVAQSPCPWERCVMFRTHFVSVFALFMWQLNDALLFHSCPCGTRWDFSTLRQILAEACFCSQSTKISLQKKEYLRTQLVTATWVRKVLVTTCGESLCGGWFSFTPWTSSANVPDRGELLCYVRQVYSHRLISGSFH